MSQNTKSALLIIDIQRALCSGEEAAFDIENLIERVNRLSHQAREHNSPVILIQHEEGSGPLQFGAEGWQLAADLDVSLEDERVRKQSPNSFYETELHSILQEKKISRLVICGLQTDFCVDTTVRQALALGFEVVLVSDCHSTADNGILTAKQIIAHHSQTLQHMSGFGAGISVVPAASVEF
ncbi:cysteine hydrolase [Hahella sp. CCB-MM4]|uniref:cysteine hydrolase family protein n=1 Tax=Hahella sp. (strain CCB-MM4) TaxID=1926491 RepID=UPI000B9AE784|nr:cysteine hydrolase family protein [Hahella sp. CCB-MM4]OZG70163.1 cysteine hydrolase [Hahella sp. CCB-MM4]